MCVLENLSSVSMELFVYNASSAFCWQRQCLKNRVVKLLC